MNLKRAMIAFAFLIILVAGLMAGRGWISSRAYFRAADRLHSSMSAETRARYGEELRYTIEKFWDCYDGGICSRNDMTDVMDRIKLLVSESRASDSDIFEFIGFVSRLYTNRFEDHHREEIRRMEEQQAGE